MAQNRQLIFIWSKAKVGWVVCFS